MPDWPASACEMTRLFCAALWVGVVLVGAPASAQDRARTVAVFDFELIDTSLQGETEGVRPEETRRLALISDALRAALAASDRYELVDTAPAAQAIAEAGHLYGCNGCDAAIAASLGADLAVAGTVQKVSNLILNINVYLREARRPDRVRVYSVDIRGNTDESWLRGISYLVRNRLLEHDRFS